MNIQSENTGGEQLTGTDIERAKEMVKNLIEKQDKEKKYQELFIIAVNYLIGIFESSGSVPVDLLEYADKASIEKVEKRWAK